MAAEGFHKKEEYENHVYQLLQAKREDVVTEKRLRDRIRERV